MYKYYNANFLDRDIADCSIRSLSTALGISWKEAFDELAHHARDLGLMMDSVESIECYLDERYVRNCYRDTTLGEFIEDHPRGTYIVSMPGHVTCVIDSINYDTFYPLDRYIYCAWKIN